MILRKTLVKYRYELEIKPYIERHVFKYEENLPKEFYTDVTYGNSIKALSIHLGCYNIIAYNRLSDFFSVISNNILNEENILKASEIACEELVFGSNMRAIY